MRLQEDMGKFQDFEAMKRSRMRADAPGCVLTPAPMVQSSFVDGLLQPVPAYVKENTKLCAAGAGEVASEALKSREGSELVMRAVRPRTNVSAELARCYPRVFNDRENYRADPKHRC